MSHHLQILTNSRITAFRDCQRLEYYSFRLGYRPVKVAKPLRVGTAVGNALNVWWSYLGDEHQLEKTLASPEIDQLEPYTREMVQAMLMGYNVVWKNEVSQVLFIEKQFTRPLINPETGAKSQTWVLGGKIDKIVRLTNGKIAIIEHKTTSKPAGPGSEFRRRLTLDSQISQYFEGARQLVEKKELSEEPSVVIYDILVKPAIKPLKATPDNKKITVKKGPRAGLLRANMREHDETPEQYQQRLFEVFKKTPDQFYQRAEIVRLERDRQEFQWDTWQIGKQLHEASKKNWAPRNVNNCFRYGPCSYLGVCEGTAALENPLLFRVGASNEELNDTEESE